MNASPLRSVRSATVAVVLAGLLAACTGDTGAGGSASGADTSPTPSAATTHRPTPTPIDVAALFARQVSDLETLEAEISGSFETAGVTMDMIGTFRVCDGNTHTHLVMTSNGQTVNESEEIAARGKSYAFDDGMWLLKEPTSQGATSGPAPQQPAIAAAIAAGSFDVIGTERRGGEQVFRLAARPDVPLEPADVGAPLALIRDFSGDLVFLAAADGTPAGFVMTAQWQQAGTQGSSDVALEMVFAFTALNETCEVDPPADPWTEFRSAQLGYRAAYPARWDTTFVAATDEMDAFDAFIAPIDGEVDVFLYEGVGGVTPNIWFRESSDLLAEEFGTEPIASDVDLGSNMRARVFELTYESEGTETFFQQAVIVAGDRAWDLNWYSTAGREDADRELFLRLVGTFEPAE